MPYTPSTTDVEPVDVDIPPAADWSTHGVRCAGCDTRYPHGTVCQRCVICDRCDATVPAQETVETLAGSTICEQCQDQWYWQCDSCDGWNRDGRDCGNGCDDHDHDNDLIRDYDYKPVPVFHGAGPLFLGPEIEIETPYDRRWECAQIASSYLGQLGYLKQDDSIGHGFEIVTHPMSYPWAMEHFPWPMLTRLHTLGCAATSSTGIHVHVSRTGFSSAGHTYRWMKFIHRNQPQVIAVARRSSPDFAAFTDDDRRAVRDYAKGSRSGDRFRAINTTNRDTFELRIFASSLDPSEVRAALGFATASVEYTRNLSVAAIAGGGWTWPAFVTWLHGQPAYRPLSEQMEALACVC